MPKGHLILTFRNKDGVGILVKFSNNNQVVSVIKFYDGSIQRFVNITEELQKQFKTMTYVKEAKLGTIVVTDEDEKTRIKINYDGTQRQKNKEKVELNNGRKRICRYQNNG